LTKTLEGFIKKIKDDDEEAMEPHAPHSPKVKAILFYPLTDSYFKDDDEIFGSPVLKGTIHLVSSNPLTGKP